VQKQEQNILLPEETNDTQAQVPEQRHTHMDICFLNTRDLHIPQPALLLCIASILPTAVSCSDIPHLVLGDSTNDATPSINSALRVTLLHCILQLVRIVVRRAQQAARIHKPFKVRATTTGWVVSSFFASKCVDTLMIAGPTVDVFKESVCVGTRSCWYGVCNYQRNGEGSEDGRNRELHLQLVGILFKFKINETSEFGGGETGFLKFEVEILYFRLWMSLDSVFGYSLIISTGSPSYIFGLDSIWSYAISFTKLPAIS